MKLPPCYIDLKKAREVLAEMGVEVTLRQVERAAEPDAHGHRRLPFFVDPVEGDSKIEKDTLVAIYQHFSIKPCVIPEDSD